MHIGRDTAMLYPRDASMSSLARGNVTEALIPAPVTCVTETTPCDYFSGQERIPTMISLDTYEILTRWRGENL
jgi:hypothetical protein